MLRVVLLVLQGYNSRYARALQLAMKRNTNTIIVRPTITTTISTSTAKALYFLLVCVVDRT